MSPSWVSRGLQSSSWKVRLPTMARLISLEYKAEQILDPYCTTQDAYADIFGRPRLMWMLNNNTSLTGSRSSTLHFGVELYGERVPKHYISAFQHLSRLWNWILTIYHRMLPHCFDNWSVKAYK
ncbi:hypothetical protein BGZ90_003073 [Linnemannia elongata]|nr:hypothetical protein BGZ90_003073 [Linnemannia elongata]